MPTLYVVIPVFNEPETLGYCVRKVLAVSLPVAWTMRIVLINDGSDSATRLASEQLVAQFPNSMTLLHHQINRGKGAALQTGFAHVVTASKNALDAMIIQDADLEYDPNDFVPLIHALESNATNCSAFGNRWHKGSVQLGAKGWLHMRANRLLTTFSNLATGLRVTDTSPGADPQRRLSGVGAVGRPGPLHHAGGGAHQRGDGYPPGLRQRDG